MKRRHFISAAALGGLSLWSPRSASAGKPSGKRKFRIAHITDMHLQPDNTSEQGIKNLVSDLNGLQDKPDFVINTGDHIMDALKQPKEKVEAQWKVWEEAFKKHLNYDLYNCIGNHDVWGWGLDDPKVKNDPLYGKAWGSKILELDETWYSFIRNGWKFICLDSVSPGNNDRTYIGHLGELQFNWLKEELASTPKDMPVFIASHIPLLSASVFFDGNNEKSGNWVVPGAWMHLDARKVKDLFFQYPNVKVAISGHLHLADQVKYLNVNYFCNGAASGKWWSGKNQEFPPSYALIDFYSDGSVRRTLKQYDWKA